MRCRHCGSDCKTSAAVPDMPAEDFFRVIDEIAPHLNPHEVFVIFTGGEALLRPDLEACGLELYRRGFPWGLVSNGCLLDESRLERLRCSGIHSVTISLDGLESDHDWMRQTPRGFQRATRAIALLAKAPDLLWDVVTCVNPRNYGQLEELERYLLQLGVGRWRLFSIFPMGRASGDPDLQLSNEQFVGVLEFVRRVRAKGRIHCSYACEGYLGPYEDEVRDSPYYCRAGVEIASILCDGSISGCTSIRSNMHQGNIYRDSFWEVWNRRFEPYRDRRWTKKGQCADCKAWRYCEGNGLHLYDDRGNLLSCSLRRVLDAKDGSPLGR